MENSAKDFPFWGTHITHIYKHAGSPVSASQPLPPEIEVRAYCVAMVFASFSPIKWALARENAEKQAAKAVAAFNEALPIIENFDDDDPEADTWTEADDPLMEAEMHGRIAAKALRIIYLAQLIRNGEA